MKGRGGGEREIDMGWGEREREIRLAVLLSINLRWCFFPLLA